MPELDLDAIEARTSRATPGPWRREDHKPNLTRYVLSEDGTLDVSLGYIGNRTEDDAEFIAHARTDVPLLVAEARKVAEFRKLAAELRANASPVLERDPAGNEVSADRVLEAEWMDHLASLIEGVLSGGAGGGAA